MDNIILEGLGYYLIQLGLIVPIICYAFSYCVRKILTCKIAKNRYTKIIPLFTMLLGMLIMGTCECFVPFAKHFIDRIIFGALFGLSATGVHQLKKKIRLFFIMNDIDRRNK